MAATSETAVKETVLVTGGKGLVGCAVEFVSQEDSRGFNWVFLSSKDGDLTKLSDCEAIFKLHKPAYVIHLAARVGGLFKNMRSKTEMFQDNIELNNNLLRCCHEHDVKRVVSMTSTCVFPDKVSYPIDETMMHDGPPHPSNEGYAYAKRMIDVLSRCYNEQYGTKFVSVIPTNVFGPHDNFNIEDGHVLPGLMHKTYIAKSKGENLVCLGTGKPLRQFIYSRDLARLVVWTLFDYQGTDPLILAPDESEEVSIADVANAVCDVAGHSGRLQFDSSFADGQFKKTASNGRLRSLYPDFKFTPFKEALQTSWDWFVANYETCRK